MTGAGSGVFVSLVMAGFERGKIDRGSLRKRKFGTFVVLSTRFVRNIVAPKPINDSIERGLYS